MMRATTFNPAPLLLLALLAVAVAAVAAAPLLQLQVDGGPDVIERPEHSNAKHVEAPAVKEHLKNCGPDEIWKGRDKGCEKYYLAACVQGKWAVCIVQKIKRGFLEKTTFQVKDGSYASLYEYLTAKADLVNSLLGLAPCLLLPFLGLLAILRRR